LGAVFKATAPSVTSRIRTVATAEAATRSRQRQARFA
jgi:hypothetical protein